MEKKKILILGGTIGLCDVVKKAKEMGLYTIITDYNSPEKSPAKKIADKYYMISLSDIDEIVQMIKEEGITGVVTGFTDSYLPYYYEICKKANLPCYGTLEQFEICTDKKKFKEVCKKCNVPVIPEYQINPSTFEDDIKKIKYPVVVKPIDSSGARGVFYCNNEIELRKYYIEAMKVSPSKNVIVEKRIIGQPISIYYTLIDGNPVLSAIGDWYVYSPNDYVPPYCSLLLHPGKHLAEYKEKIDPLVKNMFRYLNMKNGVLFIQGFYTDENEFVIMEIGYRLNGGSTFFLIDECCGYNQVEMLINFSLTGKMCEDNKIELLEKPDLNGKSAAVYVINLKVGKIKEINNLDKVKKIDGIKAIVEKHKVGDNVNFIGTNNQNYAYVVIVRNSINEVVDVIKQIRSTLSILDEDGNEMIEDNIDFSGIEKEV